MSGGEEFDCEGRREHSFITMVPRRIILPSLTQINTLQMWVKRERGESGDGVSVE